MSLFREIERHIEEHREDVKAYEDYLGLVNKGRDYGRCKWLRRAIRERVLDSEDVKEIELLLDVLKKSYLIFAKDCFEDFCIYLEWEREPARKFYEPRKKVLKVLVEDLQDLADGEIDFLGVSLPPRVGKLVSDDTMVLTDKGWKKHGDLGVGDKVISPNGEYVKVTHVFDKDYARVRVHFTDGSYADVHENHEWVVYNRHKMRYDLLETKKMMKDYESGERGKRGHRYHYQLPLCNVIKGEGKELPVEPYTLGVWLGDGRNKNPDICCDKKDRAVIERVIADGNVISWHSVHDKTGVEYYGFKGLREKLQEIGMCHSRKRVEKHIPDIYLTASIDQRLALLAGLLDTDGSLRIKERRYSFTTSEEKLRDSFISLVSTFGWRCSIVKYEPRVSSSGIEGKKPYWVISFNPTFYIPCVLERKQLREYSKQRKVAICGFEEIEPKRGNCISVEGGVYCIGERLIPTHNSTLCIFFMTWLMGRKPHIANVMSGHSDKLTDGFYREALNIITGEEYLWKDVFPDVEMVENSAKNETIDLGKKKRFPTFTARSIGGTLTGAVEIGEGGCLYVDDLIEDLEESLNPDRLQAKYDAYLNQLKDRKKDGAFELMVGTRWNVLDPLGRIAEQYEDNPRYRFRVIPALDEEGKSNFEYDYGVGFSTEYYQDMKASIDDATWCAKYMGNPYIREGLLFPADELNYYNGVLPDGDCYRVACCDVAWGGGDSLSMPFAWVFGSDVYIGDVVFNDGDKDVTRPIVIDRIKKNKPQEVEFEANNGGHEYSDIVDSKLRADGVHLNITNRKAPSNTSKFGKILEFTPDIKKFYFLDSKHRSAEYEKFMKELTLFSQTGKNKHDKAVVA